MKSNNFGSLARLPLSLSVLLLLLQSSWKEPSLLVMCVCSTGRASFSSLFSIHFCLNLGSRRDASLLSIQFKNGRRRRLKGIHSRSDTNRTGAEGLSFYYPRLLHCLDQMLAVMLLSQHRVSSSKTVRPRAPCGARCIGHAVSTWSAVSSEAPHSQFGEGARPHLCMDEWNRSTPVRRRLSLTQAARGKPIPTGLAPVSGTKARSLEAFSQYSAFHL